MKIIAHRGYFNDYIKENSLIAFKKAIIFNYPIELDVHLINNEVIVTHDIDNKSHPKLKEVLDIINGKVPIYIDIKSVNLKIVSKLDKILNNYYNEVILISFNPIILYLLKLKKYKIGLLIPYLYKLINIFIYINLLKPNYLFLNYKYYNDKRIDKLKNNYKIAGWTIKTKKDYFKYKNYFDYLVCDIYKI